MRVPAHAALVVSALVLGASAGGCATYHDQLVRSQAAFEKEDHERARALLVDLEPHQGDLDEIERARYAYIRGMSDHRLGALADARHWLAIARAREETTPGVLPAEWKSRTTKVIAELDAIVVEDGYGALSAPRPASP